MNGLSWSLRDAQWQLPEDLVDPVGRTPAWSAPDFARTAAELPQHEFGHLVAESGGRPVLAAPVLRSAGPGGLLFYDVAAMIGDDRAFGEPMESSDEPPDHLGEQHRSGLYPNLAVGMYGGYHGIVVHPGLSAAEVGRLGAELVGATAEVTAALGCSSSALLYLSAPVLAQLRSGFTARHQVALLGAESVLNCQAEDLDGYLASFRSRRRRPLMHERRAYLASPASSTVSVGPDALGPDLVELRCNLRAKHGVPELRKRTEVEFDSLARWCGSRLVVVRARLDGDTVGFVIYLRDGDTLYGRTAGFDYDRLHEAPFCYFNIVYYDTLEWGLPRGIRRLELGIGSYPGKRTRGCEFEPRFGVFDLPSGSPARAVLAEQSDREVRRLHQECGLDLDTDFNSTDSTHSEQ